MQVLTLKFDTHKKVILSEKRNVMTGYNHKDGCWNHPDEPLVSFNLKKTLRSEVGYKRWGEKAALKYFKEHLRRNWSEQRERLLEEIKKIEENMAALADCEVQEANRPFYDPL